MIKEAPRLSRAFFAGETVAVARALIGARLIIDGGEIVAQIVETEAYLGDRDEASHAFRGPTPRSQVMFEAPGHLYVYFAYGMHHCANVVTEPAGSAAAVLLRAAVVEVGEELVRQRRGVNGALPVTHLLRGPGNLCRGLGLNLQDNGLDLCAELPRLQILGGDKPPIEVSSRIGISRNTEALLRFGWVRHPSVSVPRRRVANASVD